MVIMRSEDFWTMSKKRLKRPRVNWYEILMASKDEDAIHHYYVLRARSRFTLGENRCALAAIRHYYPIEKIDRIRWLGEKL